jgi:anaerobic selenocysteine-containing dehydrogenase
VLYLVGEAPFAARPDCELVIAQDLYLPPFEVDAFLPAASFAEAEGTLTSIEGRVQDLRRVENLPAGAVHGSALPDWRIFADLAGRLGRADPRYADAAAVRAAIRAEVPGFPAEADRRPRPMTPIAQDDGITASAATSAAAAGAAATGGRTQGDGGSVEPHDGLTGRGRFVLVSEHASLRHRGIDLATVVEGLGELHLEEGLAMNPDDIARLGVEPGGAVTVGLDGSDLVRAVRPDPGCPRGAAYLVRDEAWEGPWRPVRVSIRAGDRSRAPRAARRVPAAAGKRTQAKEGGRGSGR